MENQAHTPVLHRLAREAVTDPLGGVNAASYDTAQLVLCALSRPDRFPDRLLQGGIDRLVADQNPDGSWGASCWPARYRLLPSLAATTALARACPPEHASAVRSALDYLALQPGLSKPDEQPDLMAVEFTVPALLEQLTHALAGSGGALIPARAALDNALAGWRGHHEQLSGLRRALAHGKAVPAKFAYSAELAGPDNPGIGTLATPLPIGCSAAATAAYAAWSPTPQPAATRMIVDQVRRLHGGVPDIMAMTTFETLWILGFAIRGHISLPEAFRKHWVRWLSRQIEPEGVRGGPGLPPDGDDTAAALYGLHQFGRPIEPAPLIDFVNDQGCASYPGERTRSTTTTAHAFEAISGWLQTTPEPHYRRLRARLLERLLDAQTAEGAWHDKWHVSPHYATYCVVIALARFGGQTVQPAIRRARDWLHATQRADGSWGQWAPTLEETALALLTLHQLQPAMRADARTRHRAIAYLRGNRTAPAAADTRTPLWQGKELYEPRRIVHAAVFTALTAATRNQPTPVH
ncbi:prenyltransferase/squalene oxidase repeat-containing protein [Nocardia thraciensis]